ncbi:MAG: DUF502 domain-containing protein [Verrucomicrobia bacterium]|nr:DUF502 domain-containing protein [Verrucomicrobiota bacterium]
MKKYFLTGLAILLPLAITLAVVGFIINMLTDPFLGIVQPIVCYMNVKGFLFLSQEQVIVYTTKLLILVLLFGFIVLLGMVGRWFAIRSALGFGDRLLHRIPIVNTVYKTTKDIIHTLFSPEKETFKKVVLVPFPRKGVYTLALISTEAPKVCSEKAGKPLVTVLIPTTPNPTTGFLLMYPMEDLIPIDMRPEQAIKYIVSCGMITPEKKPTLV